MSAQAAQPTTAPFSGLNGVFGWAQSPAKRTSRTTLNRLAVAPPVATVIALWNEESEWVPSGTSTETSYPTSPTDAVAFIVDTLDWPQQKVLGALGIPERTFFGWKEGHRPRSKGLHKLWAMTDVLYYMRDAHPNLASWFSNNEEAQRLFTLGDSNGLALLEFSWSSARQHNASRFVADFDVPTGPESPAAAAGSTRERHLSDIVPELPVRNTNTDRHE